MSILPLLTPTGIPRAGLVAWHDLYFPNVLPNSENLSAWSGAASTGGVNPVVTPGQTDPLGGTTAFRVQFDGGESTGYSLLYQTVAGLSGCYEGMWLKSNTGTTQKVCLYNYGWPEELTNVTTSWQYYSTAPISSTTLVGLAVNRSASGNDQTADVLVWHPQLSPSATLPPYEATTSQDAQLALYSKTTQKRNLLWKSEEFESAPWVSENSGTAAAPVFTAGQADPFGGTGAYRVVLDRGAGDTETDYVRIRQTVTDLTNPHTATISLWMKSYDANTYVPRLYVVKSGAGLKCSVTPVWQRFEFSYTREQTNHDIGLGIIGAFGMAQTADILIYGAQLELGSVATPYESTQTRLQLGSATTTTTNDPVVLGPGLGFVTDDYAVTGNLSGVTITGPWTQVLVALPSGTVHSKYVSAVGAGTTNFFAVRQNAPGTYELRCAAGGSVASSAAALTVPTTAPVVLAITCSAGVAQLSRLDTGASITGPDKSGATGATPVSIGSLFSASIIDALTVYAHLFYNRALSNAELERIYRSLKATWAARGVDVT